ncbi:TetR/AcrR family transcriptional regulator [Candidatus Bipolaricaulota bacterium]|nr:TetR/AcrR family transcriptional regulator [Candidatus Bipolaricaulota bacterium]
MNKRRDTEMRKDKLLEAASDLFLEKGYRDTSVNSIVESIGVSKGTFYYYFDSKVEVLDGLVDKFGEPIYEKIDGIIEKNSLNAIEKLNRIFSTSSRLKLNNKEDLRKIFHLMYRPENLRLRDKIQKQSVERSAPKVAKVLKQGIEEGTLDTELPEEASRLILHMGTNLQEEMSELLLDDEAKVEAKIFISKYRAYENAIERVVGAPVGSIELMEEADLKRFLTCFDRNSPVKDL